MESAQYIAYFLSEPRKVLYLSATVEGSLHDKALADEMELEIAQEQALLLDLDFVGYKAQEARPSRSRQRENSLTLTGCITACWPACG